MNTPGWYWLCPVCDWTIQARHRDDFVADCGEEECPGPA